MDGLFGDDGRTMEQPRDQKPTSDLLKNGLVTIAMTRSDAGFVIDRLKERIRRITWLDDFSTSSATEVWRAARLCYEIRAQDGKDTVFLTNLSREDLDIVYDFPKNWNTAELRKLVDELRARTRPAGPAGPIEADLMAKELTDLFEC